MGGQRAWVTGFQTTMWGSTPREPVNDLSDTPFVIGEQLVKDRQKGSTLLTTRAIKLLAGSASSGCCVGQPRGRCPVQSLAQSGVAIASSRVAGCPGDCSPGAGFSFLSWNSLEYKFR